MAQTVDWLAVAPAAVLAVATLTVLLIDLWWPGRATLVTGVSVGAVMASLIAVGVLWGDPRATFCVPGDGLPSCSYVVNELTLVLQGVVLVGTLVVLLLSHADTVEGTVSRLPIGETRFLLLASATGAVVLAAGRDLATIVVALEVVSLPAFALVGLRRAGRRDSEAALTFFVVSVVSIGVMIYGVSLVYGATGALHLDRIALALGEADGRTAVASAGVVLTLFGLAFKIGAVPFHFWVPDTYDGAPVVVAAYLSVVSKAAGIAGLVIVVGIGFPAYSDVWGPIIGVMAVVTMTLGNVAALRQRSAIRLLAWSSVAHAGYLLVPLGAAAGDGGGLFGAELSATVSYLALYVVINLAAFGVVVVVSRSADVAGGSAAGPSAGASGSADVAGGSAAGGRPGRLIEDYRGLAWSEPATAVALAFGLIALAGLPPGIAGLWAKVVIVDAAVSGGAGWLAIAVAINTVIGLVYYLRWTVLLFTPPGSRGPLRYDVPATSGVAVGIALAAGVAFSVVPQIVLGLTGESIGLFG
jgi:NADH-quinone oxidoreductase subunit N